MARKNALKSDNPGSIHFDPRTKSVMAETSHLQDNVKEKVSQPQNTKSVIAETLHVHLQDNVKEKVSAVREVVPGRSNNEIILVLQFYDYNVEKAIQAYVEDGAKQALQEWHYPGNKAPKKKRNKKKKPANDSQPQVNGHVTPADGVPNGISNGSVESDTEPLKSPSDISSSVSSLSLSPTTCSVPVSSDPVVPSVASPAPSAAPKVAPSSSTASSRPKSQSPAASGGTTHRNKPQSPAAGGKQPQKSSSPAPTKSQTSENSVNSSSSLPLNGTAQPSQNQRPHPHSRQQHHSGSHSHRHDRQRTASERSSDGHMLPKQVHKTLEKSVKDLHRQTVSLERLKLLLNEEMDKNYKRIKTVFEEMRDCLNSREVELIREMDEVKAVASDTLSKRQKSAIELKLNVDRAERFDDKQLSQLKADIKHFVGDRKIDEDLSRTTRFLYDSDYLRKEIQQFGEVVPVKCTYSLRRPSVSSVTSNEDSQGSSKPSKPVTSSGTSTSPSKVVTSIKEPVEKIETMVVTNSLRNSAVVSVSHDDGDHPHGLNHEELEDVAELQQRLKNSLHIQGYDNDKRSSRPASQPSKENMQDQRRNDQRSYGGPRPQSAGGQRPSSDRGRGRGYGYRGRGGGYRGRGQGRPRSPRKDNSEGRGRSNVNNSSP